MYSNNYIISRAPAAQRAAKQSTIAIGTEPNACKHACKSFFMIIIVSIMDPGHVLPLKAMTKTT